MKRNQLNSAVEAPPLYNYFSDESPWLIEPSAGTYSTDKKVAIVLQVALLNTFFEWKCFKVDIFFT